MFNMFQKWRWKWCRGMVTDFKSFGWRHHLHRPTDSIHFLLPTFILLLNPLSATLRTFFCWAEIECWAGETREARRPPLNGVCQPELKSWQAATERGKKTVTSRQLGWGLFMLNPPCLNLTISVFLLPCFASKMDCQKCPRQCLQCQCLQRCALALTRALWDRTNNDAKAKLIELWERALANNDKSAAGGKVATWCHQHWQFLISLFNLMQGLTAMYQQT